MTTTSTTRRLWTELVARFTAEPIIEKGSKQPPNPPSPPASQPHPPGPPDLLQRHLLCDATGLHDRGPDGRCRDCAKPLTDADPVCRDVPMGGPIRGQQ